MSESKVAIEPLVAHTANAALVGTTEMKDMSEVLPSTLQTLSEEDFAKVAQEVDTLSKQVTIVVGRCLVEARRRYPADRMFGAWIAKNMPGQDSSDLAKLIAATKKYGEDPVLTKLKPHVFVTLAYATASVVDEVKRRIGASPTPPSRTEIRRLQKDARVGAGPKPQVTLQPKEAPPPSLSKEEQEEDLAAFRKQWMPRATPQDRMTITEALAVFGIVLGRPNKEALEILYRGWAMKLHPDKETGSAEKMALLNEAREILK